MGWSLCFCVSVRMTHDVVC
ncbi:hypothetical protein I8X65_00026745 [Escherichia coli]